MEFTVKAVDANVEEKSRAQVEETLLKQHEEQFEPKVEEDKSIEKVDLRTEINSPSEETLVEETNSEESVPEFTDTDVLSYIKKRYNKDINSVDELFAEKEANEDLPEDVSKYLKYKQETGRGINDFYKLDMATKSWAIILVIFVTLFTSTAQILYKLGVASLSWNFSSFINNYFIFGGLFLYGLGAILLLIALRAGETGSLILL